MRLDQFKKIMPRADSDRWYQPIVDAMNEWQINTPARQAAFLANLAPESDQLRVLVENLNYSAEGLARTWPTRFAKEDGVTPTDQARLLARRPEQIANTVYANRMGNGPVNSGDGWKYRGAGPMQITGRTNQETAGKALSCPLPDVGEWLRTPEGGARAAARHWALAGCNEYADAGDFDGCCDAVNIGRKTERKGDAIGYAQRAQYYNIALPILMAG